MTAEPVDQSVPCRRRRNSTFTDCPCPSCRPALLRAKKLAGLGRLGDISAIRSAAGDRLWELLGDGWSIRAIADAYDLMESAVDDFAGRRRKGIPHRPGIAASRRILAGPVREPMAGHLPCWPCTRRVRALARIGWANRRIAAVAGVSEAVIWDVQSGLQPTVAARSAAAIRAAYTEMENSPALSSRGATRVRNRAATAGWAPPASWEDIDDPDALPVGVRHRTIRPHAETVAEVIDLLGQRAMWGEALQRLGMKAKGLEKALARAGRGDLVGMLKTHPDDRPAVTITEEAS